MKLTIEQRQKKLETVASYDISVLKMSTNKELSELCKDLIQGYSKLSKDEKIQALISLTEDSRAVATVEDESMPEITLEQLSDRTEATEEEIDRAKASLVAIGFSGNISNNPDNETNLGIRFYRSLKKQIDILEMSGNENYSKELQKIVSSVASRITQNEAGRLETKTIHGRKNRRTEIIRAMRASLKADTGSHNQEVAGDAIDVINTATYAAISDTVQKSNLEGKQKSNLRNESPEKISVVKYFQDAYQTMNNLESASKEEIFVALAILTGRRPSEIYCSGTFKIYGNHWIEFQGQNKKKANYKEDEKFILPVFCKAALVLKAILQLEAPTDKEGELFGRYPFDPSDKDSRLDSNKRADSKFSKTLSRYLAKKEYEFTSRQFRAMYGELSYQLDSKSSEARTIHNLNDPVQSAWFRKVLGHDEASDANTAYLKYLVQDESEVLELIQANR